MHAVMYIKTAIRNFDGSDGIDNANRMALLNLQDFGNQSCHHLKLSSPCKAYAWSIIHERKTSAHATCSEALNRGTPHQKLGLDIISCLVCKCCRVLLY